MRLVSESPRVALVPVDLLTSAKLSWAARGLMAFMLQGNADLKQLSSEGNTLELLKELKAAGWISTVGEGPRKVVTLHWQQVKAAQEAKAAPAPLLALDSPAGQQAFTLAMHAQAAATAYNEIMAVPQADGRPGLPRVALVTSVRVEQVRKAMPTATAIAADLYGLKKGAPLPEKFWADFFSSCRSDDFLAGRLKPSAGHEGWRADFEFLLKPKQMTKLYDKVQGDE